jgi:hypothetical protein
MPAFIIQKFGGALPVQGKRLLPDNFAQAAVNCDLISGELRGVPYLMEIKSFTSANTYLKAFRIPPRGAVSTETWMPLQSKRGMVVPYAISNDAYLRYVTIDGNDVGDEAQLRFNTLARMNAGSASYILGIPKPTVPATVTVAGGSGTTRTRSYVYTFVDSFGQEGQPSDPVVVTGFDNGTWNLTALATSVPDPSERTVTTKRIYRTVFANSGVANFRRVADISLATSSYADTILDAVVASNSLMECLSWAEPPEVEGLLSGPGGFLVGWADNDLFFSEPYRPWAWPPEYTITVDYQILGCAFLGQTLVVITESSPVFITGSTPSAMAVAKSETVEAGVIAPSIVSAPDGCYFATKTGLLRASAGGLENATQNLISKHDWTTNYGGEILSAARYETTYIGMTGAGEGFMLDWRDARVASTKLKLDTPLSSIYVDPYSGELHGMVNNKVYLWFDQDAGRHNLLWRSKEFVFPQPVNISCGLVSMDVGATNSRAWGLQLDDDAGFAGDVGDVPQTVTGASAIPNASPLNTYVFNAQGYASRPDVDYETSLTIPDFAQAWMIVYANGRRIWQGPVYDERMVRFPSGFKSTSWEISIVSSVTITGIRLGTTAKDLKNA